MAELAGIVLAAGLGTRMKSSLPKVMHTVAGRPMVWYMTSLARRLTDSLVVVVVGHGGECVRAYLESERDTLTPFTTVVQSQQRGTGHAVRQARRVLMVNGTCRAKACLILNGDTPLLTEQTVRALIRHHRVKRAEVTVLTTILDRPSGYGRIVRDKKGHVLRIVEERDATPEEREIREVNVGTYIVNGEFLFRALAALTPANAQGELYLPDIIGIAVRQGRRVAAMATNDPLECLGVNTREQLACAEREFRRRIAARWMEAGVTLRDPATTYIDSDVHIGRDTILYPQVMLEGRTRIGEECVIRSHTRITDSIIGNRVAVQDSCVMNEAIIEDEVTIGPFAHLRPGSRLRVRSRVGNFVELKHTELGEGTKANHLSYLGDAIVGREVNIGAGTITCNFDGFRKDRTVIDDHVFVGSDSQLVAPVTIGRGALIAAGSTVTQDVPADALCISRAPQVIRPDAAARRRAARSCVAPSKSQEKPERKSLRRSRRATS